MDMSLLYIILIPDIHARMYTCHAGLRGMADQLFIWFATCANLDYSANITLLHNMDFCV